MLKGENQGRAGNISCIAAGSVVISDGSFTSQHTLTSRITAHQQRPPDLYSRQQWGLLKTIMLCSQAIQNTSFCYLPEYHIIRTRIPSQGSNPFRMDSHFTEPVRAIEKRAAMPGRTAPPA